MVISLTVKYVSGLAETTRTILFSETIDLTQGDFVGGGYLSDWIAIAPGSCPHSIQVSVIGREELTGIVKTLRGAGLSIFGLARTVQGIGIL